jgi:hypothetical protein
MPVTIVLVDGALAGSSKAAGTRTADPRAVRGVRLRRTRGRAAP